MLLCYPDSSALPCLQSPSSKLSQKRGKTMLSPLLWPFMGPGLPVAPMCPLHVDSPLDKGRLEWLPQHLILALRVGRTPSARRGHVGSCCHSTKAGSRQSAPQAGLGGAPATPPLCPAPPGAEGLSGSIASVPQPSLSVSNMKGRSTLHLALPRERRLSDSDTSPSLPHTPPCT